MFLQKYFIGIPHLRLGPPIELFPSGFLYKTMYEFIFPPIHSTCSAYPKFLDLITQIILGDEYKS